MGTRLATGLCFMLVAVACLCAEKQRPAPKPESQAGTVTIEGLLSQQNRAPVLKSKERTYRLVSPDSDVTATLADPRVAGKQLRVEGRWKTPDTLEVVRFFTVREGKLYKLIYYCDICSITSYRPGPCVCCQNPVEPREIPADSEYQ